MSFKMTMPDERFRAVMYAKEFLIELSTPTITKRIPKEIRQRAYSILRHFPDHNDLKLVERASPEIFQERMEDVYKLIKTYEAKKDET